MSTPRHLIRRGSVRLPCLWHRRLRRRRLAGDPTAGTAVPQVASVLLGRWREMFAFACVLCVIVGCGPGKAYRTGRRAEKRGAAHNAYDAYCRAGRKHPGSSAVASGIKRSGPAAAAFWEDEANAATVEGRHADAWRMWMRVLDIQPEHSIAPGAIRRIERQYPTAIADARAGWLRRGAPSLALANPRGAKPSPDVGVILAARPTESSRVDAVYWEAPLGVAAESTGSESETLVVSGPESVAASDADLGDSMADVAGTDGRRVPGITDEVTTARPEGRSTSVDTVAATQTEDADRAEEGRRKVGEFLVIRTLSKRDHRYPRRARIIDGIAARLKDTDSDLDADIYLYAGDRRIKKIRELPVGQSQTFRGRSGKKYRLTILNVHHKTRTVRIGIKPA